MLLLAIAISPLEVWVGLAGLVFALLGFALLVFFFVAICFILLFNDFG
jgi:hypothetical protein